MPAFDLAPPMTATRSGARLLFVMAAELEFGPRLRALLTPLFTGVGPIEAAVSLTAALAAMQPAGNPLPDFIVSLGSAGSRSLAQGEVRQATHVSWRDIDASPLGFEKGRTPFVDLPRRVALPVRIEGIAGATLSTGSNVVSGAAYDRIDEDMVDMETYAHLRAAMRFGVPLIALRGISDGAEELRHFGSWADALPALDAHLAEAVEKVLAQI
jgi:adenosylhomocysteine nucleosidase